MADLRQIERDIKRRLKAFDFQSAFEHSTDEAKTRHYLINPFFDILGYEVGFGNGQLVTEYDADYGTMRGKKVDYAILFRGKPNIIIEAKSATYKTDLQKMPLRQLNDYFNYLNDAKIGILTNGIQFHFYSRYEGKGLNTEPFFSFDFSDINTADIEGLAQFHLSAININEILEIAEEEYFRDKFDEALYQELSNPSNDLVKAIFNRMEGSRLTASQAEKIRSLINSVSLKSVVDRLVEEDAGGANSGIVTTEEELQVYQIIRTILAQSRKVVTERVTYRDQKTVFSILIDDNIRQKICDLQIKDKHNRVLIMDSIRYEIPDIDSILKLKKQLIDKAASFME